jgi:hypothetical protein
LKKKISGKMETFLHPKSKGALGIKYPNLMNKALEATMLWNLVRRKDVDWKTYPLEKKICVVDRRRCLDHQLPIELGTIFSTTNKSVTVPKK